MNSVCQVFETREHITIMISDGNLPIGTASANPFPFEEGWWWLARVKVDERSQGHGFGTLLLMKMFETLSKRDIKGLIVAPGGYGSDPARLDKFYRSNGFVDGKEGELRWHKPETTSLNQSQLSDSHTTSNEMNGPGV